MKPSDFAWNKLNTVKREKPLGSLSPIVWVLEPSHGCNLKCGHCCAELVPRSDYKMMSREVWDSSFKILNEVSPTVRVDLCGMVGEPTLNPKLTDWLPSARRLAPRAQIQITTNGTMLLRGKVTFKRLLDAGANIVYVDQYGDKRKFEQLASESGYPFYQYYDPPEGAWTPWQYWGPHVKMIVLMDPPDTWPKSRFRAGLLGNWYGNLNWEKGRKYAMKPLERPLTRRCNQPFLYVNVAAR